MDGAHGMNGDAKSNEDKKIFVGGLPSEVADEDLKEYFTQFGPVTSANVKYDMNTGRSRGFAFIEFESVEGCQAAMIKRHQTIKNKMVEVKPAKSRENKKVFVGGLPSDYSEKDLSAHFEEYGKVEEIEWPVDRMKGGKRNFAFVIFEEESAADKAASVGKHAIADRECDVRKATPQSRRGGGMFGMGGRGGGGRGGRGGRGGNQGGMGGDWYGAGQDWYSQQQGYGGYPGYGAQAYGYEDPSAYADYYQQYYQNYAGAYDNSGRGGRGQNRY